MVSNSFSRRWSAADSAAGRVRQGATKQPSSIKATILSCILLLHSVLATTVLSLVLNSGAAFAIENPTQLWIGKSTTSITPSITSSMPVALDGSTSLRTTSVVDTPVTANVVVLESRQGDNSLDASIMVSCDLLTMPMEVLEMTRQAVHERLPSLDTRKIFLNGTHTHTAPCARPQAYQIPETGVIQPEAYREFLVEKITDSIITAWETRQPGGVSWGLGHAVVANNRRAVYADGTAIMYGDTDREDFVGLEGPEDHGVQSLFFWDMNQNLIATAVNVACPAQEMEGRRAVNADYWHEVREDLRDQYGQELCVLSWCGAAGDQSPHMIWRNEAEERMRIARGLTRCEEISRRIVNAVDDAYEVARNDIQYDNVTLMHLVEDVDLPVQWVNDEGYYPVHWVNDEQYYQVELHAVRVGDVAIATNPFELYTQYGIQMQARSDAEQTFVVQLTGPGSYLPTSVAVEHGGYSASGRNNVVGPEGGQILVDHTVEEINKLMAGIAPPPTVTLAIVDNGCPETGLHSYTLTATGIGITTLSEFTIDGELYQVFHAGEHSEWLGNGSALETDTTDSYVIFGDLRVPDVGGEEWDEETYPGGLPDKFTEETIDEYGFGTLNNSDSGNDVYLKIGTPSDGLATVDLMQIVVVDGDGFSVALKLLTSENYNPITMKSLIIAHNLTFSLPTLTPGDADGNGYVDSEDAAILAQHWLQGSGAAWADGDFNRDGKVNDIDATLLAANWNPQSASVPEPSSLLMALTALIAAAVGRFVKRRGKITRCQKWT